MLDYAANYGLSQPVFVIIEMSGVIAARDVITTWTHWAAEY